MSKIVGEINVKHIVILLEEEDFDLDLFYMLQENLSNPISTNVKA
jgi:hypothetical protein